MNTANLVNQLDVLQDNTIGFFKPSKGDFIWLVIENDEGHLKCVHIGNLGGLSTLHIPATEGKLHMFADNKTLTDLKANPFELEENYKIMK